MMSFSRKIPGRCERSEESPLAEFILSEAEGFKVTESQRCIYETHVYQWRVYARKCKGRNRSHQSCDGGSAGYGPARYGRGCGCRGQVRQRGVQVVAEDGSERTDESLA